ncbi:sulfotransferase family protein [Rasiella sp. SM2506]|uniref:sulfotransferase family protein n=1 Tax=Rasiella sp. SM2506 TaxID=3423914 RepID=UPI003D7A1C13
MLQKKANIPNLFIVGAPKCGTTSMYQYLGQHPSIFPCPVKEPHFFNFDSKHRYYSDLDTYINLFSTASGAHDFRMEASVWYLYSEVAIAEILKLNPNATFIILLRKPAEMFLSLHQEFLFSGAEVLTNPIEAWIAQQKRETSFKSQKMDVTSNMLQYGKVCSLGWQVARAHKLIPKRQLKIILLEDIISRPSEIFGAVLDFLQLPVIQPNFQIFNKQKQRKSILLQNVLNQSSKAKLKMGFTKSIGVAGKLNKWNRKQGSSISEETKRTVYDTIGTYFNKDIELLEYIIGRELNDWKTL